MRAYWILFLCLPVLWTSGCAGARKHQVNALERENSQLNGLLWELEFEVESLQDENQALKKRLDGVDEDRGEATSRPRRAPKTKAPEPFDPGEFQPPKIEFPDEPTPKGLVPETLLPSQSGSKPNKRQSVSMTTHEEPVPPEPTIEIVPPEEVSLDSRRIKRIQLASLIGTLHLDDEPGDDGLVVVVEPWDGSDQMLADAADITVVLIDPAEAAETSRYAQWQFEAKEVAKLFRDGDLPGIHLELPWPDEPPRHDRLHLFIRYVTSDGRKLEADSLVEVELGGRGRWVAAENPRIRPYEQPIQPVEPVEPVAVAPRLFEANLEPVVAKPVASPKHVPVRTVSAPRERVEKTKGKREGEPTENRTRRDSNEYQMESLQPEKRVVEREPERPARPRPAWSPDRPW